MSIISDIFDLFVYLFGQVAKLDFLIYLMLLAAIIFGLVNVFNYIRKGKY